MTLPALTQSDAGRICRIPLPRTGKSETHLRRQLGAFRKSVEAALMDQVGEVCELAAKRLGTVLRAVGQAARIEKRLAESTDLPHEVWMAYSDRIVKYHEQADRAMALIGLELPKRKQPWQYWTPEPDDDEAQADPEATDEPADAPSEAPERPEGDSATVEGENTTGGQDHDQS